jgi:hypothetical protein
LQDTAHPGTAGPDEASPHANTGGTAGLTREADGRVAEPRSARLMRSWPVLGLVALAVLIAAALVGPFFIANSSLAAFVEKGVCPEFGATCHVEGELHVRLLPYPAIDAAGLTAKLDGGRVSIAAEQASAELRVLPLLLGRFTISQLNLGGARIEVAAPPEGMRLLATADDAGAALLDEMAVLDGVRDRPSRIVVRRSKLTVAHALAGAPLVVDELAVAAAWPRHGGAISAHIAGHIGAEALAVSLDGPSLVELGRTEGSHVSLGAILGGNTMSFAGRLVKTGDLVVAGAMQMGLPSLKVVARALGHPGWPPWLSDMPMSFDGSVFVSSRGVDIDGADLRLAHSGFSGVLSLRTTSDGRPALMGTLAAASVNIGDLAHIVHGDVVLPDLARMPDLDLRLSVRRLATKKTSISGVAIALILAERRLDLTVSHGTPGASGGRLRVIATPGDRGLVVKGQLATENSDIAAALSAVAIHAGLAGSGSIAANLDARGTDVEELARSAAGRMSLRMKEGSLSLALPTGGSVARRFDEASFAGSVKNGILDLDEGRVGGGEGQIKVTGRLDIPHRSLDLSFEKPQGSADDPPWRLRASGSWSQPVVRRD